MKIKLALIAAALFAANAASAAEWPDNAFYAGVGVGQSKLKGDAVDYVKSYGPTSIDDKDTTGKAFVGYKFNRYFGTEVSANYLGHYTASNRLASAEAQARSLGLDAVLTVPVTERFGLIGKAGVARTRVTASGREPGWITSGRGHDTGSHFAVGAQYKFSDKVALRGELERQNVDFGRSDNRINSANVSLVYTFGSRPATVVKTTYVAPAPAPVYTAPAPVAEPAPAPAPVEAPVVTKKKIRE